MKDMKIMKERENWAIYRIRISNQLYCKIVKTKTKRGVAIFATAFMGIPAQQAAKITRPLMPAAAPAVLVTRSLPNK
ncbi:hypothetical protein, partial [Methylobacter svalbardensis]|uniref:hypothetical protein n=1 Tax=Methylobacter svalbardensis TaxID=3080016 RepID=UPI0030ED694D